MMNLFIPFVIEENGKPVATIEDGMPSSSLISDLTVRFNYHVHLQMIHLMSLNLFRNSKDLKFVTFTHYSDEVVADVVFENENLENTLGEVISKNGLTQAANCRN